MRSYFKPQQLLSDVRDLKLKHCLKYDVSAVFIFRQLKEVHISSDAGRFIRTSSQPFNNSKLMVMLCGIFQKFVSKWDIVVYKDAYEITISIAYQSTDLSRISNSV